MFKYILNFLFIFLMLSTLVFANAKSDEIKLQNEFGKDLTHVPFFLRFSFQKQYGKEWKTTYYSERKAFLSEYEIELARSEAQEKADARAEADAEKDRLREKREAEHEEHERLKAKLAEEKSEERADADRQKSLDDATKQQQKELRQMEQQITQGN